MDVFGGTSGQYSMQAGGPVELRLRFLCGGTVSPPRGGVLLAKKLPVPSKFLEYFAQSCLDVLFLRLFMLLVLRP